MLVRILSALPRDNATGVLVYHTGEGRLSAELDSSGSVESRRGYGFSGRAQLLRTLWESLRIILRTGRRTAVLFAPGAIQVQRAHWILAGLLGRRVLVYVPMSFPSSVLGYQRSGRADFLTRVACRMVDGWITISQSQRDLLLRHWRVTAPILVIPNFMDGHESARNPGRSKVPGKLRILFLGRFDAWQKGLDWLCEALPATVGQWKDRLCFCFRGDGPYRPELERLAGTIGDDCVVVDGWQPVEAALQDADVLLLPSRFEGVPLVFMEAVSAGIPVVSTTFPGAVELVGEDACVPFGDTQALLCRLLQMTDPLVRRDTVAVQRRLMGQYSDAGRFHAAVGELARMING